MSINYSPKDYEIEYKITNKLSFFKRIQQFLDVEKFERTIIHYYKSTNKNKNKYDFSENIRKIEYIDEIKSNNKTIKYEIKTLKYKNNIEFDNYELSNILLKVSKEKSISEDKFNEMIDKKLIKEYKKCYRYRLIFNYSLSSDFPFEIDLSLRVFPKSYNSNIPSFTDEDLFNPTYINSDEFSTVYDLEFEILKTYSKSIDSAFKELMKLLKKACEEKEGKIITNSNYDIKLLLEDITDTNETINLNGRNKIKGGDNFDEIDKFIERNKTFDFRRTPQVSVLTNKILQTVNLKNFVYLEKTDGLRTLLVNDSTGLYSFRNKEGLIKIFDSICNSVFIVDSEYFKNKYYIFDVYYVNIDIREMSFINRMNVFKELKLNTDNIIVKEWKEVIKNDNNDKEVLNNNKENKESNNIYTESDKKQIEEILKYGMTKRDGVDGIVFQSKEGYKEWLKKDYQYKLKPLELTTTDYLYKYHPSSKIYYLFLCGSFGELIFNLRARPRCLKDAYDLVNLNVKKLDTTQKQFKILFDTPLFENMYFSCPTEDEIKKIEGINEIKENDKDKSVNMTSARNDKNEIKEGCLDSLIIETMYDLKTNRQIPIRIRSDKEYPNSYRVGLANACILFSPPVPPDEYYFQNITKESVEKAFENSTIKIDGEELINSFHLINQRIRDYTFSKLKKYLNNTKIETDYLSCLDLCGGRGSDLKRILNLGFNNIIAVDADAEALTTYSIKSIFYKALKNNEGKPITQKKLSLNCIKHTLGNKDDLKLALLLKRRYEFKPFELVVIDYALHYICNDNYKNNLKNLVKMLSTVCAPKALILINFYDGDKIVKKNGEFKIFKIEIEGNEAKMPLPTIEINGYRKEPLVFQNHIDVLKSEKLKILEDYYPNKEKKFDEGCVDYMNDYLNCIRSIIFEI